MHNETYLKKTRRLLRNNLTTAEATLWKYLKAQQLEGRKFRRQHSINNYIVDFYCPAERLIIELDGSVHDNLGQANADVERDERLKELGFRILRLDNNLVLCQIDTVLEEIKALFTNQRHSLKRTDGNYQNL